MTHSVNNAVNNDAPTDPIRANRTLPPLAWRNNLWLFLATAASVFWTGMQGEPGGLLSHAALKSGAQFTATLLGILIAHEFGHFIAARLHKVEASLPFFIPIPFPISQFGTMGAVIRMRGAIPTRRALLDIGASGPLAGLAVAIPAYAWGAAHSTVVVAQEGGQTLGESLLLKTLDHWFAPAVGPGMDLSLSPVAYAGWIGMFITMINLLPIGQLDGGHVAYSLFGPRQDRVAVYVHRSLLAFFFVSLASFLFRDLQAGFGFLRVGQHIGNSLFWLGLFEFLAILGTLASPRDPHSGSHSGESLSIPTRLFATFGLGLIAALGQDVTGTKATLLWLAWFAGLGLLLAMEIRWGALRPHSLFEHPTTARPRLGWGRSIVAAVTLAMFVLLFMPTPLPL